MSNENNIYKLKPFFSERIWGGDKLKEFGFNIPSNNIGEAWVISAHDNGMGYLNYNGKEISLKEFYKNKDVFKDDKDEFPLLVKIITANDYLSVQVHPDDIYAKQKHNSFGKPESWYVLDCPKDAKLIYGHKAKTVEEIKNAIDNKEILDILEEVEVNKGDFLYVEPGKIHAITPGVTVYELQRSSDITYRLFDYNRVDDKGQERELHIEDSLANIKVPDSEPSIIRNASGLIFESKYFSLFLHTVETPFNLNIEVPWMQLTVIEGQGKINGVDFVSGESAIYINESMPEISGDIKVIISWIK
ncbi:mannose-6-phosphate isomerase [Spiroplasma chinense]|uniref:Mannose-6-phosphate isomerase n=1 Tax=Spiroplasma chinense TaxID=216932 RepID=A0A5B9Y3G4_9MOLU|nr:type I phosphomannose isomerase catalytic subunit [Spiroplasma chinense]QEH61335.1 mannose-6-phosphate isomerase [Spiroplasma chinense]